MKRLLLGTICSAAMIMGTGSVALAGSSNHSTPGTPGAPNCHGQSIAYLNYLAANGFGTHGIGGLSDAVGLSVQQIPQIVDTYCGS